MLYAEYFEFRAHKKEEDHMEGMTHFNARGEAHMVDVSEKGETVRSARARGKIYVGSEVFRAISEGSAQKGDVLAVARIAGIMGAKRTSELIPLCHIVPLTGCSVEFQNNEAESSITVLCEAHCIGKTGVEMEALTGVQITLLTIYDMCKAMNREMIISDICLLEKDGGKSGHFVRETH